MAAVTARSHLSANALAAVINGKRHLMAPFSGVTNGPKDTKSVQREGH